MRHVFLALILASLSACSIHTSPSLDPLVELIREQNDKLNAMQEQMTLLQNQVAGMKDRPPISPGSGQPQSVPQERPTAGLGGAGTGYRLLTSPVAGQKNMDAIYVLERATNRLVVMMFNANNEKLDIVAGREVNQDVKVPDRGRTRALPVSMDGGTSIVVARASLDEHVLVMADDANHKLLIYKLDNNRKRLELVATEDLQKVFNIKAAPGGIGAPAPRIAPAPPPPPAQPLPDTPARPRPAPGAPPF